MCRREVMDQRAAAWYYRAFGLAKRSKDRQQQLYALLGYGTLLREVGRVKEGRRFTLKAARLAGRSGRLREAAEAAHDLMLMDAEQGALTRATQHADRAERWYPVHHPRVIYFVHDFAFLLLRGRNFGLALVLLEKALPLFQRPDESMLVWSTLAWAAGGAGRPDRFATAESVVLRGIDHHAEFAPAAWLHLAEGARSCGRWATAAEYAARAADASRMRKEPAMEHEALELSGMIAARRSAPDEVVPTDETISLARRFTMRLRKAKAPDPQESRAHRNAPAEPSLS
jgi:tetratricopeptide (TPR) repeat protein